MPSPRAIWLLVCPAASRRSSSFCLVPTPARYASGHLLGQRGTHARVEAIAPRAGHAEGVASEVLANRAVTLSRIAFSARNRSGLWRAA
jgi:hypothetical protein